MPRRPEAAELTAESVSAAGFADEAGRESVPVDVDLEVLGRCWIMVLVMEYLKGGWGLPAGVVAVRRDLRVLD